MTPGLPAWVRDLVELGYAAGWTALVLCGAYTVAYLLIEGHRRIGGRS